MNANRFLLLFLFINLINYVDRQVVSGVAPLIQKHFSLSDASVGLLATAFMITYALTSVPLGMWSDRWYPHKIAAIGVAVWSVASLLSAVAWSFDSLFLFRALVGIGEAAYVTTAATILSNVFPEGKRATVLGWFNLGIPLGGAIGVVLGGWIGTKYGWPWAFTIAGLPGFYLAYLTWKLPLAKQTPDAGSKATFSLIDVFHLLRNKPYLYTCIGYAGITFAFGAVVFWMPTFFERTFGYTLTKATLVGGGIEVVAGLLGAPIGGYIADFWQKRNARGRAYTLVIGMGLSALFFWGGLYFHSIIFLLLATFFMLWHVGVASALIFHVTNHKVWNTASALALLIMHLFGDIPSPLAVGVVSDHSSLFTAFALLPLALLVASLSFFRVGANLRAVGADGVSV